MTDQSRITPQYITTLNDGEIFVFGSNKEGMHGGGTARIAYEEFGAKWGEGIGMTGRCYAIPTMDGSIDLIQKHVDDFIAYAKSHPESTFLVTPIGCGIAGWKVSQIAPLFRKATDLKNVTLPESFWQLLSYDRPTTPLEAIRARHSVRRYRQDPIPEKTLQALREELVRVNADGNLNVQLVVDEPKAFSGVMAYGKFSGVRNYFIMAGKKSDDLNERIGYYGERLVLLAQQLGLNTCWAGISYRKVAGTYKLENDEKIGCYIAVGFGETQGVQHKSKSIHDISNASEHTPEWFKSGVEAALLAPTAVNQQKFYIEYLEPVDGDYPKVRIHTGFSVIGYTHMDMGIARLHFEIGAGDARYEFCK